MAAQIFLRTTLLRAYDQRHLVYGFVFVVAPQEASGVPHNLSLIFLAFLPPVGYPSSVGYG